MDDTWFKIHRKIFESWPFADAFALKMWIWLIGRARITEGFVPLKIGKGTSTVRLTRGQLIFGRSSAEEKLGIDGSKIYRLLKEFEIRGMIKIEPNNHYSIISICNYDIYQGSDSQDEQPVNSQWTAIEQPMNTNKKDKKVKNENIAPADFELWWLVYPKKVQKNRAIASWSNSSNKPPVEEMIVRLKNQIILERWTEENWQYIPNPANYLDQARWEDEIELPIANKPKFTS